MINVVLDVFTRPLLLKHICTTDSLDQLDPFRAATLSDAMSLNTNVAV